MEIKTKYNIGDKIYMVSFHPLPSIRVDYIGKIKTDTNNVNKKYIEYYPLERGDAFYEEEINKITRLYLHARLIADNKERALEILKMYLEDQYKHIEKNLNEEE